MRFLQIASFYQSYLATFYARNPHVAVTSFDAQIAALLADGFGGGHLIAPYMTSAGYESTLIITNALPAQSRWALDHGLPAPQNHQELSALVARQIEILKPDILYVLDPISFDGRFLAHLTHQPRVVVGWRAANIPTGTSWTGFDLMLSSDEGCRRRALELGALRAAPYRPGFPVAIAKAVASTAKTSDLVFCGQMTVEHQTRLKALVSLLGDLKSSRDFSAALHLGLPQDPRIPSELRPYDRGAVWGMDMYRAVRSGKIAPNFHIDLAASKGQNMRIFETLGVGSFLLTEQDASLAEYFEAGREVETYSSHGELVEKINYYLDHDVEREAIAKRGQDRCLADFAMERRAEVMASIVAEELKHPNVPRHKRVPATDDVMARLRAGQLDEAASLLNAAIQKDSRDGRSLYLLGRVAFHAGQVPAALQLFQTALSMPLPASIAWACAADAAAAFIKLGSPADAVASLRKAFALRPDDHELAARLAALLSATGATEEARLMAARLPNHIAIGRPPLDLLIDLKHLETTEPHPNTMTNTIDLTKSFPSVSFGNDVQCIGVNSTRIGYGSAVGDGSWLNVCIRDGSARMVIGDFVLVGRRAVLSSGTYLEIGAHTIFGPNVYVSSAEHEYVGNDTKPILMCGIRDHGSLIVEENCWLGMNAIVSGSLTMGRGSVVGANSVLRQSTPPFSIAVGSPARVVRMYNPESGQWESTATDSDRARIEAARLRKPLPERAAYKKLLDAAQGGRALDPLVAGRGLHLA